MREVLLKQLLKSRDTVSLCLWPKPKGTEGSSQTYMYTFRRTIPERKLNCGVEFRLAPGAGGGWMEDAEDGCGQRPRRGRLHYPRLPLPRLRPLLLCEERVVRAALQEQHGIN
jgi:hypothetical protein